MVTATSVEGGMKMGNIAPRARFEPTSLAFRASVLAITLSKVPDVTTVAIATCVYSFFSERSVQFSTVLS